MSTILVVDDDVTTLRTVEQVLTSAGHRVATTAKPEEAVELAVALEAEAVILDVMMPGRSGYEVLAELQRNPRTSKVPVLMLSCLSQSAHRVKGLREGADEYVAKPFDPDELVLRLNRLLATSGMADAEFQGRLETVSFAEVVQSLLHGKKNGILELVHKNRRGEILIEGGRTRSATFGRLEGRQAVLAMLELDSGSFSFVRRPWELDPDDQGPEISLQQVVFTSVWLHDEMGRWPEVAEEDCLWVTGEDSDPQPTIPDCFGSVPLDAVRDEIVRYPGIRLGQLVSREIAAPKMVHLAVRILIDTGALGTSPTSAS